MGIIGIFLVCLKEGWNKCCDWFCKTLSQPVVNMVRDSNKTAFLKLKICANNTTLTYSITHTSSPPPPMQSCFENDLEHSSNIDKGEGGVKMDTLKRWGEGLRVDRDQLVAPREYSFAWQVRSRWYSLPKGSKQLLPVHQSEVPLGRDNYRPDDHLGIICAIQLAEL